MKTSNLVQILVHSVASPQTALRILSAPDSGFRVNISDSDLRPKFRVGVEASIAIVGFVLQAAQLAVAIYRVIQEQREKKDPVSRPVVVVIGGDRRVTFAHQSAEEIHKALEEFEPNANG